MVDRCEIATNPCTVVDLDGTYINGNTLKIYLSCGIRYLLSHFKIRQLTTLVYAIARRKAGISSHNEMKAVILSTLYPYTEILNDFKKETLKFVNSSVNSLIYRQQKADHRILLATAAPEFYVSTIWDGDLVATKFTPGQPLVECLGEEKLRRVKQWLHSNNCHLDTVVTDHKDDAPLFHWNKRGTNILVNPSQSTLSFFRELQPTHFLLIEELQ